MAPFAAAVKRLARRPLLIRLPAPGTSTQYRVPSGGLGGTLMNLPPSFYIEVWCEGCDGVGDWGILLQSSHERHADGMPPVLRERLRRSDLQFKKTSFGWLECGAICGRETWYFQRQPLFNESRYAVVSVTCQETNICKLAFSYKDMDVEVTLDRASIADVPQILQAAQLQIKQLEVGR